MKLLQGCEILKGVGPNVLKKLHHLGIFSIFDLLLHLPLKYEDRTRITPISQLKVGHAAVVQGRVVMLEKTATAKSQLICAIQDESAQIFLRFFHFSHNPYLSMNNVLRCYGEVRFGPYGLEMVHPDFECIFPNTDKILPNYLSPVYPTMQGLGQRFWRKVLSQALMIFNEEAKEVFSESMLRTNNLLSLKDSFSCLHQPSKDVDAEFLCSDKHPARQRLIFEEFTAHQLSLRYARMAVQKHRSCAFQTISSLVEPFRKQLPFRMTSAQDRVCDEILKDLAKPYPMLRLVQGDVGSGKTVVAALAAMQVIGHGAQAVMMAPTEILAEQHFNSLNRWVAAGTKSPLPPFFKGGGLATAGQGDTLNQGDVLGQGDVLNFPLCKRGAGGILEPIKIGLLHGKIKSKARREMLEQLARGEIDFIVGTHALFQEEVLYKNLGLVIIDEQHRFGVHQRLALRNKGVQGDFYPHQLIMTATPIPRTLAMCAYADLDYSVIDELPPGRKPVTTVVIDNLRRDEVIDRISKVCLDGRQVYWVCTLIEDSEVLQAQNATETFEILNHKLPHIKSALIHGRLPPAEKEAVMHAFKRGEIQLLIATTVIEVGVDVPNASLMVIENAERLGLAQLHQLRGRVGRGSAESHCVLLYQAPLSKTARHRLQTMRESHDGFYIAEQDLQLRGPGEFLGARQTGEIRMRVADLIRDADFLPHVQQAVEELINKNPDAAKEIYIRWLAGSQQYGHV